jgi:hypothetical protein
MEGKQKMGCRWIRLQTHNHTLNSDGKDTLSAMAGAGRNNSIDAMFLTDHNTMAALSQAEAVSKEIGISIIGGIEYTTFYGHIIAIGAPYFRWENIAKYSLNELADFVHSFGGIIGIAHPRGAGDPTCTGGSYSFEDFDFNKIDFMEVWHSVTNKLNEWEKNDEFWIDKLNRGYNITGVYGGDFHCKEHFYESGCFNWALVEDTLPIEEAVKEAIKKGQIIMSKGPVFSMKMFMEDKTFYMGDTVKLNNAIIERNIRSHKDIHADINIDLDINVNKDISMEIISGNILVSLVLSKGEVKEAECSETYNVNFKINLEDVRWIRTEIIDKTSREVLAVSNPIYIK